ncbi:MAG: class GN sortase [Rhodospirillaceae bacterium]|jgi:sortase A|nr:class GN sortase [Rhodospirillaceae bacterium]
MTPALVTGGVALGLGLVGLWQLGDGAATLAKATLSGPLINHAWAATRETGSATRPWPWADTWPVARLSFPRLARHVPVLSGADGSSLAFGPGHVAGTAAPGEPGSVAIAAHRDTHFNFLKDVEPGDRIELEPADGPVMRYRVTGTAVVDSRTTGLTPASEAEDAAEGYRLTLITCYPFDALEAGGPMRYLVFAEGGAG